MLPTHTEREFRTLLQRRGLDLDAMTPAQGVQAMADFYADTRADDCDLRGEGDMLLLQWGCYDWGEGERFEFDLTRQLIWPDHDDEHAIWQLSLTFRFAPDASLRALGEGYRWCGSPSGLPEFVDFVTRSPAFAAVEQRAQAAASLEWASVE